MTNKNTYQEGEEFLENLDDEPNVLYGHQLNQHIGTVVKRLRLDKGFSQEQFGELIGTKKNNVSMLENGKLNPSILYLDKVANAFNMEIEIKFKER